MIYIILVVLIVAVILAICFVWMLAEIEKETNSNLKEMEHYETFVKKMGDKYSKKQI